MNLPDAFNDDDIMHFGKHKGKIMENVPVDYLKWVWETMAETELHQTSSHGRVLRYIFNNRGSFDIDVTKELKQIEQNSKLKSNLESFPIGNILVFDTETNDVPAWGQMNNPRHPQTPHIVELGAKIFDAQGNTLKSMQSLVKPKGWKISEGAQNAHGISLLDCEKNGKPIEDVIVEFHMLGQHNNAFNIQHVVCYNVDFDALLYQAECLRLHLHPMLKSLPWHCAMKRVTDMCKIPHKTTTKNKGAWKFPKLQEAHKFFFGAEFDGAHGAVADLDATYRVFKESFSDKYKTTN